jgi:hypothetical protein
VISSVTVLAASVILKMLVLARRVTVLGESVTVPGGGVIILIIVLGGSVIYAVNVRAESKRRKLLSVSKDYSH